MDEKEKAEYLKNELKNYNKMKKWLEDDSNRFDMYIEFYNIKIAEYDALLNAGNAKGIDYDYIPTTAVNEPVLSMLAEQEKLIKRRDELIAIKEQDIYGFKARVKYIEECFDRLDDDWEREFIKKYYCNDEKISKILNDFPRSRSSLYDDREKIIMKML